MPRVTSLIFRLLDLLVVVGLIVAGILAVVYGVHYLYFISLPRRAVRRSHLKDPEGLGRYLERVEATPSLLPMMKAGMRINLIANYVSRKEYAKGAAMCRKNLVIVERLRGGLREHSLEADLHQRLADCLEGLGEEEEAKIERGHADALLHAAPDAPLRFLTKGKLLEREHSFQEAYEEFLNAYRLTSAEQKDVQIECMIHLFLSAFNAGRADLCQEWAERAIEAGAERGALVSAHRMAGTACGNLGLLDESEEHLLKACEVAAADDDKGTVAELQGTLADCLLKRGKLQEAYDASERGAAMHPKGLRMARFMRALVLNEWGRFDETLAILEEAKTIGPNSIANLEKRMVAVVSMDMSRIEVECGRLDEAWRHIHEALEVLSNDANLGLKCDGALSWILAARGEMEDSRDLAATVETRTRGFDSDPGVQRSILHDLAMGAALRGEFEEGVRMWDWYLSLKPHPVYAVHAYYQRGECYRQLKDVEQARGDYEAAVGMGIDSYPAKFAKERLRGGVS